MPNSRINVTSEPGNVHAGRRVEDALEAGMVTNVLARTMLLHVSSDVVAVAKARAPAPREGADMTIAGVRTKRKGGEAGTVR